MSLENLDKFLKSFDKAKQNQYKQQELSLKLKSQQPKREVLPLVSRKTERDGVLGFLDSTLGRVGKAAHHVLPDWLEQQQEENYRRNAKATGNKQVEKMLNTTSRPAKNKLEKGADIVGTLLGEAAPYTFGGYGLADKALKITNLASKIKNPLLMDLVRGATAGSLVGTGKAVSEDMGSKMSAKDYTKTIGLETAFGAGGDMLFGAIGRNINLKGQLDELLSKLDETGYTKYDDETFKNALDEAFGQKGNPINALAPKPKTNPQDVISQLQKDFNLQKPKPKYSQEDLDFQQELFSRRQAEEDAFVKEQMKPFDEMLNQSGQADLEWQTSVKQAKEMSKRIKDGYGPIIVPEGNWADWGKEVPNQFKAKRGETKGIDLYKFADEEGFSSVDEAVQFLKEIASTSSTKLKDLKPADDMKVTSDQYTELENAARQKFAESENGKAIDSLIESILGKPKAANGVPLDVPVPKTQTRSDIDSVLRSVSQTNVPEQVVKNSQVNPTDNPNLLRLDLQHNNTTQTATPLLDTNTPTQQQTAIDMVENPIMRAFHKFYEGYANMGHSAKVAEKLLLDKKYKPLIEQAKQSGDKTKVEELLKQREYEEGFEKAFLNEQAAAQQSKEFLEKHLPNLQQSLGPNATDKDMADALEYLILKDIQWNKDQGIIDDKYGLPDGWDWGKLNTVTNVGDQKYGGFVKAFRNLTQEWRDIMLRDDLISKAEYDALGKNPYYVPKHRAEGETSNVWRGKSKVSSSDKRRTDAFILNELGNGSVDEFFKNPLEAVMSNTFTLHRNALKNDTAKVIYRLAQIDKDGELFQEISKEAFNKYGGIEVNLGGTKAYVKVQDDLMKMMDESEEMFDTGKIEAISSIVARLKTSSLEYQSTAVVRDLATNYLTSQITNPFRYLWEIGKSTFDRSAAKELGASFGKQAYTDGYGGVDPKKVLKAYAEEHGIHAFDAKSKSSWKRAIETTYNFLTLPGRKLGEWSDEVVRDVEVKETKRVFDKKFGAKRQEIEQEIASLQNEINASSQITDPFDPKLQGIDQKKVELSDKERELKDLDQALRREQIYRGRDVMNYSRVGRGKWAKRIRRYVMFANTTTQSKDKLLRSLMERPLETTMKAAIVSAPIIMAQKAMFDNMSEEDQAIYHAQPDWMKQSNYVFVHNGEVMTLPKVQELSLLMNPIESILAGEGVSESVRTGVRETLPYQTGMVLQGLVPDAEGNVDLTDNAQLPSTVAGPLLDAFTNRKLSFNQKPISYQDLAKNKEGLTASNWASPTMLQLFGDTPKADYMEYLTRQYGGDAGKYALGLFDFLGTGDVTRATQAINPLQDRFYKDGSAWFKPVHKNN